MPFIAHLPNRGGEASVSGRVSGHYGPATALTKGLVAQNSNRSLHLHSFPRYNRTQAILESDLVELASNCISSTTVSLAAAQVDDATFAGLLEEALQSG